MAWIEATLDADGETSDERNNSLPGPVAQTLVAGVERTAGAAAFDVRLQIGMLESAGTIRWFDLLTLDKSGEAKAVVPAMPQASYRFRAESVGAGNTLRCMATL